MATTPEEPNRTSLTPLSLLGILAFGFTLISKISQKRHHAPDHGDRSDEKTTPPEHCKFEACPVYPVRIETAEENQWKTDQKQYWSQQLNLAKRLNVITSIGGAIAFFYLLTTFGLWLKARESLIVQQKPWLGISAAAANYVAYELPGKNLVVHGIIRLKNFGQSPALLVYPLVIPTPSTETLEEQMRKNCETAKDRLERSPESGIPSSQPIEGETVFPSQEIDWPFVASDTAVLQTPQAPLLVGCIYYRDQWKNERHTQFCYYLNYTTTNEQLRSCTLANVAD